jgi:hypothetical protein
MYSFFSLCKSFEEIASTLLSTPTNVAEMVALQKAIEHAKTVSIKMLEESIDDAKKR